MFCLVSCNLGCTDSGCSLTDIAQNQPLVFVFSQEVDPRTVDLTNLSLKTLTGEEPVGTFLVEGSVVTFIPEVQTVQGATFFGFAANEEYALFMPGGTDAPTTLLSTSGRPLRDPIACNLRISRGIVDLNGVPPEARLVTPTSPVAAPQDTAFVLEFNEIIDQGPFFDVSAEEAPIQYRVRQTIAGQNGGRACDPNSQAFVLSGQPRLEDDSVRGTTSVSFRPPSALPPNTCVEIVVTTRVRDLAGVAASPQTFQIVIQDGVLQENFVTETFDNDLQLDTTRSGGEWTNGDATFATLGGDGRHGDFDFFDGTDVGNDTYVFDTDGTTLQPKASSFSARPVLVDDGRFFFSRFVVPAGITVRFVGSKPARIHVRGTVDVQGQVEGNGVFQLGEHDGKNSVGVPGTGVPGPGQDGTAGGPMGGRGGNGAQACDGTGNPIAANDGLDGEDVQLPMGHAYAGMTANTGGKGGTLFPPHGNQQPDPTGANGLTYDILGGQYTGMAGATGGGGGFNGPGGEGETREAGYVLGSLPNLAAGQRGPGAAGGITLPSLNPLPAGVASVDHYLVGGAGGGGGGSHPLFARNPTDLWRYWSGGGGAGGGGAMNFRVGRNFIVGAGASVEAEGGTGEDTIRRAANAISRVGAPAPGGGGAGGTLLLQIAGNIDQQGTLSVRGGPGMTFDTIGFFLAKLYAGDGAPGYLRLEVPTNPQIGAAGQVLPSSSAQAALLEDSDQFRGFQSQWFATDEAFPPAWSRYEIDATVDGVRMTFSDDPNQGQLAIEGAPLIFWVQGADVDPSTGSPLPGAPIRPWRRVVRGGAAGGEIGLSSDSTTGFRWALLQDSSLATTIVVHEVRIIYQA